MPVPSSWPRRGRPSWPKSQSMARQRHPKTAGGGRRSISSRISAPPPFGPREGNRPSSSVAPAYEHQNGAAVPVLPSLSPSSTSPRPSDAKHRYCGTCLQLLLNSRTSEASYKGTLDRNEDQDHRQSHDHYGCKNDILRCDLPLARGADQGQRLGQDLQGSSLGGDEGPEVHVPRREHGNGEICRCRRLGEGDRQAPEDRPPVGAVDAGGVEQLLWHLADILAEQQRAETG